MPITDHSTAAAGIAVDPDITSTLDSTDSGRPSTETESKTDSLQSVTVLSASLSEQHSAQSSSSSSSPGEVDCDDDDDDDDVIVNSSSWSGLRGPSVAVDAVFRVRTRSLASSAVLGIRSSHLTSSRGISISVDDLDGTVREVGRPSTDLSSVTDDIVCCLASSTLNAGVSTPLIARCLSPAVSVSGQVYSYRLQQQGRATTEYVTSRASAVLRMPGTDCRTTHEELTTRTVAAQSFENQWELVIHNLLRATTSDLETEVEHYVTAVRRSFRCRATV